LTGLGSGTDGWHLGWQIAPSVGMKECCCSRMVPPLEVSQGPPSEVETWLRFHPLCWEPRFGRCRPIGAVRGDGAGLMSVAGIGAVDAGAHVLTLVLHA
jgi:hypothetical protein